jgi:hypothetical protein
MSHPRNEQYDHIAYVQPLNEWVTRTCDTPAAARKEQQNIIRAMRSRGATVETSRIGKMLRIRVTRREL